MNTITAAVWRYATKKFDPTKKVEETTIQQLTEIFNLVPTSYGLQPVRLHVVSNQDLKDRMVEKCYGQGQVRDCSHVLVLSTLHVDADYIEHYFKLIKNIRHTPEETLAPFKNNLLKSFEKMSPEQNEAWARNQAYIALGMLMSACADTRIDSCPMEGFIPTGVDNLLELDKMGLKSCLLLPIGYRAGDDMFASMEKVRLPLEKVVKHIF